MEIWPKLHLLKKLHFSINDFFSKCDQIRRKLRIWSHLLKKSLKENFIFRAALPKLYRLTNFKIASLITHENLFEVRITDMAIDLFQRSYSNLKNKCFEASKTNTCSNRKQGL